MQRIFYSLSASEERRPDYLVLTKTCLEDDLVWRTKGLDAGALAVLSRVPCVWTPPMAESGFISATATFTASACRHLDEADDGGSLGSCPSWWGEFAGVRQPVSYHLGCPLVILDSST